MPFGLKEKPRVSSESLVSSSKLIEAIGVEHYPFVEVGVAKPKVPSRMRQSFIDSYLLKCVKALSSSSSVESIDFDKLIADTVRIEGEMFAKAESGLTYRNLVAQQNRRLRTLQQSTSTTPQQK